MSDGGGAPGGRAAFDGAQARGFTRLRGWLARGVGLHLAVIAGLLLLSVVMWWRVWVTGHPTSTLTCQCGDPSGALADLAWAPWAVIHGHNPFFSNAIYAGQGGANMLANTTWIAGSLLFAPVTWLFGPVATLNVVMTLAPVASGWFCFLAVRQFTRFVPGQVVAALLYGFSPFIVGSEVLGHLAQVWLVYPPLAFLCLYDLLVTKRHRPFPLGVGLGLLTVVQFFLSSEVLAISVLMGGIGLILAAVSNLRSAWAQRRRTVLGLTTAVGIVALFLAYPTWFATNGPRHMVGYPFPGTPAGLATWGVFSAGPQAHQSVAVLRLAGYGGNLGPPLGFLGAAVLVYLAVSALVWFRDRLAWVLVVMGVLSWAFSLGAIGTWTPWRIFRALPFLSQITPYYFSAFTVFAAALLLALSADRWWRVLVRLSTQHVLQGAPSGYISSLQIAIGGLLCLVTLGTLVPVGAAYSFPFVVQNSPVPPWFSRVATHLPPDTVVLTYPYPSSLSQQPMGWQAIDGLRFRLVGGSGFVPGGDRRHSEFVSPIGGTDAILTELSRPLVPGLNPLPSPTSSVVEEVRHSLRDWGVQIIAVPMTNAGRDSAYAAGFLTAVLGRVPVVQHRAWVWYGLGTQPPVSRSLQSLRRCTSSVAKDMIPNCVLNTSQG